VAAVWGVTPSNDLLLLHRIRKRLAGPDQVPLLRKLADEWQPDQIGIEAVAFQLAIVQEARRDGLPVVELKPDRDKVSRALTAAARLEGGNVWWPKGARWLDEWESELLLFPNARHDDQVDALSYAALEVVKRRRSGLLDGWRGNRDFVRRSPWKM
jgi:predicted phage terminase large subunit-like protein